MRSRRVAFMDALVLAIAAGEKRVTRRMSDPRVEPGDTIEVCEALVEDTDQGGPDHGETGWIPGTAYRADRAYVLRDGAFTRWPWKVRVLPARYCPAWAVRYRCEVVSVRPEPLTAIDDADAVLEGIARMGHTPDAPTFLRVFRDLHGLAADANPTVFRIEFRLLEATHG